MAKTIEQIIQDYFPNELIDFDTFSDWCRLLREDAFPGAINLLETLDNQLESIKKGCIDSNGIKRDYWEIFGGDDDKLIKSVASIRSKLARALYDELRQGNDPSKQTQEQLANRVFNLTDLGRTRIIADFSSDLELLQKKLLSKNTFLETYRCPKKIKDFVFDPKLRDGLKGHRAKQFSVRVPIGSTTDFGFEVQLMTRLQHAWDRRNHPLYEWQRENPGWHEKPNAVKLAVDDFACAEALHLVDRQADINWRRLQKKLST